MNKILKYGLRTIVGLLLVVVVAVAALVLVVDPNDYKDDIANVVEKQTGRQLQIEGDLAWQLWPPIGISIGKTQLSNHPDFGEGPMVKVDSVVVDVAVFSLLDDQLVIDEVNIDGLYLHLIKDKSGKTNLDDLTQNKATSPSDKTPSDKTSSEGKPSALPDIQLSQGVNLTNVTLINEDRQAGTKQQLSQLNLHIGQFGWDRWFDIGLGLSLSLDQQLSATLDWQAELKVASSLKQFYIQNGEMVLHAEGAMLPKPVDVRLENAATIDLDKDSVSITPLKIRLNQLHIDAPTEVTQLTSSLTTSTKFTLHDFDAKALLTELGIVIDTAKKEALTKLGMQSHIGFDSTTSAVKLSDILVKLDSTTIKGKASVVPGEILNSRFQLAIDTINVDDYLAPASEKDEQASPDTKQEQPAESSEPDLSALRTLDVEGKITVGSLVASKVQMQKADLTVTVKDGLARINPLTANLYEGSIETRMTLNAQKDTPAYSLWQKINGVQATPLLKALADVDVIAGATNFETRITGSSFKSDKLLANLTGNGKFSFLDGAVKGINIAQMLRQAQAQYAGKSLDDNAKGPLQTDFTELGGQFTIAKGKVFNPDLQAKSPLFRVTGQGDVDLVGQNIDYIARIAVVESLEGQGGKSLRELRGLTIPLTVKGELSQPKLGLKLDELLTGKAKAMAEQKVKQAEEEARKKLDKEKQKLEQKAKDKLQEALKDKVKLW